MGHERMGDGGVQGWFFSWCSGVIRGVSLSGRGVRWCSGLFRVVRDAPEGLTVVSFVNPCQPSVNLCHGLVTVGKAGAALLWRERHGVGDRGVQTGGGGSVRLTPHLTSPLEGGRD